MRILIARSDLKFAKDYKTLVELYLVLFVELDLRRGYMEGRARAHATTQQDVDEHGDQTKKYYQTRQLLNGSIQRAQQICKKHGVCENYSGLY
jgi:hypothetical protein